MSLSETGNQTPETGLLPGRYEWVEEPTPGEVPTDPEFEFFSDAIRSFEAEAGASLAAQTAVGSPDALDHNRGMEEPSAAVEYDLQRFPVDGSGNPADPSAYGIIRDEHNQLPGTILATGRRERPGGNDNAGVREYTVVRGWKIGSVTPTLDPSTEQPILMELDGQPRKVRSYLIHQPSDATTLDIVSTAENDTMDVTIETEGASTTETIALDGTTAVTTSESFGDIDAVWLSDNPEGDIKITDGSGTTLVESTSTGASTAGIAGGLTYSDDDQPVDGDRGVPALGAGSRATEIAQPYEHFLGDRFERPAGSAVRPRVNSASWTVENDIETNALHSTRSPSVDEGNRTVSVDADVAGEYISHNSMAEALQKTQHDLEHELSGGTITFKNTVPTSSGSRSIESEQAVASLSETLSASGDPAIVLTAN